MDPGPVESVRALARRARRLERRQLRSLRRELETTRTLIHLSVLLVLPVLIAAVTLLSNAIDALSFLLFPPLAAGSYTLFAHPEGRYASPRRFVGGLTVGALCGWAALLIEGAVGSPETGTLQTTALAAGLCVFLVAALTWALDIEVPAAYSTALLAVLVPADSQLPFLGSVLASTLLLAGAFWLWRERFYERRAEILYETTSGDDRFLIPMLGPDAEATAILAGQLAVAHDGGKVVLLDVVENDSVARAERDRLGSGDTGDVGPDRTGQPADGDHAGADRSTTAETVAEAASGIETRAERIEEATGVLCQVVVAARGSSLASTITEAARSANCDVLAVPYATADGELASHVASLFRTEFDVVVHRSNDGRSRWKRVLVPVRGTSDVAHAMLEFATRLVGSAGRVSVAHCLGGAGNRRWAVDMLADLVEQYGGHIDTTITDLDIEPYLEETADGYDLLILGASQDRSAASRLVSRPTFERIRDIGCDVAIVDRN